MVKIRFSAEFNNVTHSHETIFEIENTTVKVVIDKLTQQFGSDFEKLVLDKGKLRRFVALYINGEEVRNLKGLDSPVKNSDEISIFPVILM